ncbi:16S rRNA (uracil(1498)-N(3))-methyltransferase [Curvivirga sp.]|uniref:16S rRNA (uracil(1498)-N(3))-methyltransferase n=1 Tax=Curvivirga sp. TaxID=2856848 RepID=UPI003B5B572C
MTPKAETRLFIDTPLFEAASVSLDQGQAHYLRSVLRLQIGAKLILFNGQDGEWIAEITDLGKKNGSAQVIDKLREQEFSPDVWLLFAPLKKTATDLVFQKATELGVSAIKPVITKHSNTERMKLERAQAIVIEAAEQCERLDVPEVQNPSKLEAILAEWPEDRHLFVCAEAGPANAAEKVFVAHQGEKAAILIGPEGGFAVSELEFLSNQPFISMVGLGPRVLRAETAVLSALSCWQAFCGDWQSRPPHRE